MMMKRTRRRKAADVGAHARRPHLRPFLLNGLRLACLALLASLLLTGCGAKDTIAGSTPEATAGAFVEAMRAGEYDRVAAGFDYQTYARRENPDWDTFGQHQRELIVSSLREGRERELRALAGMFAGEVSVRDVQQQDQIATAAIEAGANTVVLRLRLIDGEWLIGDLVEATSG